MKTIKLLALAAIAFASGNLAAQAPTPSQAPPENFEEVVGTLGNDAKIAIPAFATNADVATQTSAGGTAALGFSLASEIGRASCRERV